MSERDLEAGLAQAQTNASRNAEGSHFANGHANGGPLTAVDEKQALANKDAKAHHHHHHHHLHVKRRYRERLHLKRKQRVESKLPGIMQGADNLQEAHRRLTIKNEIVAAVGEFVGTFLFLFFSFGIATIAGQQNLTANSSQQVQDTGASSQATSLDASQLLYSSLGFGFSLATNAWCFYRVSGGLFNPQIAFALFLTGSLTWYRFIILVVVEFLGGIAAAGMANVLIPGGINARTKLAGSTTIGQGFCIEMFMTAQLAFAVFMLAGEKHRGTFLAPVGIGLSLFIAELWATPFTGGSLNSARSLGPDVVAHTFDNTAWIYYTAPFLGAIIATIVYKSLKLFKYETAVEGQDDDAIALVMKNARGQVTGFVDQVPVTQAPEIVQKANSLPTSPTASMINLATSAGAAGPSGAHSGVDTPVSPTGTSGVPNAYVDNMPAGALVEISEDDLQKKFGQKTAEQMA